MKIISIEIATMLVAFLHELHEMGQYSDAQAYELQYPAAEYIRQVDSSRSFQV